jgi:hypothetical protein
MLKYSVLGLLLRIVVAAIILPAPSVLYDAACVAQEKPPLERLAEAAELKGERDVSLGQLCDVFNLVPPTEKCVGYQISPPHEEIIPSFNTFIERSSGTRRIILVKHDSKAGYAYLTGLRGELLNVARGLHVNNGWTFNKVAVTRDIALAHSKEIAFWIENLDDIEKLPDRKD